VEALLGTPAFNRRFVLSTPVPLKGTHSDDCWIGAGCIGTTAPGQTAKRNPIPSTGPVRTTSDEGEFRARSRASETLTRLPRRSDWAKENAVFERPPISKASFLWPVSLFRTRPVFAENQCVGPSSHNIRWYDRANQTDKRRNTSAAAGGDDSLAMLALVATDGDLTTLCHVSNRALESLGFS
jgi:hypothetical protein